VRLSPDLCGMLALLVALWRRLTHRPVDDYPGRPNPSFSKGIAVSYHFASTLPLWLRMRQVGKVRARDVLDELRIDRPPVDVVGVARALGAEVLSAPGLPHDGMLESEPLAGGSYRAKIYVKAERNLTPRQRFTVAHELGHLMLHEPGRHYRDTSIAMHGFSSPEERAANRFASELLMPDFMVRALVSLPSATEANLAAAFKVSKEAMGYRLADLQLNV
jgi:hypothetical protein